MRVIGRVTVKEKVLYTEFHFGDLSRIQGKELKLLSKNEMEDCLCLVGGRALVDIDARDVERVTITDNFIYDMRELLRDWTRLGSKTNDGDVAAEG